jgi:hypothetical protein
MQIFIQSFITQVVQRCIHTSVLSASGACKAGMSGMVVLLAFSADDASSIPWQLCMHGLTAACAVSLVSGCKCVQVAQFI